MEPNNGFGADFERYSWVQTLHDVTITIPVNASLRARNVDCRIEPNHLYICIKGEESPILNGNLYQRIKVDNSVWTLETENNQRYLRIELEKNEGEHWWPYAIQGEKSIDVSKIEPPPVNLDALDGSVRSQVEKMMYEQNHPKKESTDKDKVIQQFMKDHPEMDFSQEKY